MIIIIAYFYYIPRHAAEHCAYAWVCEYSDALDLFYSFVFVFMKSVHTWLKCHFHYNNNNENPANKTFKRKTRIFWFQLLFCLFCEKREKKFPWYKPKCAFFKYFLQILLLFPLTFFSAYFSIDAPFLSHRRCSNWLPCIPYILPFRFVLFCFASVCFGSTLNICFLWFIKQ